MDPTTAHIRRQLATSIRRLIDNGLQSLSREDLASIISELLAELQTPDPEAHFDPDTRVLTLTYPSHHSVNRDLASFSTRSTLEISTSPPPPRMTEIAVHFTSPGLPEPLKLSGRSVHETADAFVLQLFLTDEALQKELTQFAKKIALAGSISAPTPSPSALTALHDLGRNTPNQPRTVLKHDDPHRQKLLPCPDPPTQQCELTTAADFVRLLLDLARIEGYAILELSDPDHTYQLVAHYGELIDYRAHPPRPDDALLAFLQTQGHITQAQRLQVEELASSQAICYDEALVDLQMLARPELLASIRARHTVLLRRLFTRPLTRARAFQLTERPSNLLRSSLPIIAEVVSHLRTDLQSLSPDLRKHHEAQLAPFALRRARHHGLDLSDAGFNPQERRLLKLGLHDPQPLNQILSTSPLGDEPTLLALLLFDRLGLLERSTPATVPAPSNSAPAPAPSSWQHQRFQDLRTHFQTSNPFALLRLHWSAYDEEVQRAYDELSAQLTLPPNSTDEDRHHLATMQQQLRDAHQALTTRQRRNELRNQLVDSFSQRSSLQLYHQKADSLRIQRDIPALIEVLHRIVELDPSDARALHDLRALKGLS